MKEKLYEDDLEENKEAVDLVTCVLQENIVA